jgi:hydrogenase maturation protein HypF
MKRNAGSSIAPAVAPHQNTLGVMLPYSPLHHLLLNGPLRTLVMTSGNISDEPIAYTNEESKRRLGHIADYFLFHNRDIHMRCDDSVTRIFEGKPYMLRRSRGYVPFPIKISFPLEMMLACGGELKNTFCLTRGPYAFMSPHIGDLENLETLSSFEEGIEHFRRLWLSISIRITSQPSMPFRFQGFQKWQFNTIMLILSVAWLRMGLKEM